jgi:D-lactate dehydrogenase
MGFDFHGKTAAVVGTGKIGRVFARIMLGFGCNVIGYDPFPSAEFEALGARYVGPVKSVRTRTSFLCTVP